MMMTVILALLTDRGPHAGSETQDVRLMQP
jgi:hypothetical protein